MAAADIKLEFTLNANPNTKPYHIVNYSMEVVQHCDFKGQPQIETQGGVISFTIDGEVDDFIHQWMIKSSDKKSGKFVFKRGFNSPPMIVVFEKAYCIHFVSESFGKILTRLTISAEKIDINGIDLDNRWK